MSVSTGMILQNRYEIVSKIASGGMADVFRATDNFLQRVVAIKILNQVASSNQEVLKKFYKEVEATSRIRHDNIVEVYDVFEEQQRFCIVLELVSGSTLKDRLIRTGPLGVTEALHIFSNILNGVAVAHQGKIIHRDLKPENILISYDGKIKVSDFGIAIVYDNQSSSNNKIVGTAKYISPETVQSLRIDFRSDIYSLGIMLFELLTGMTPFNGQNPTLVAIKHVRDPLPSARKINNAISQSLENVIIKATAKNAKERYQDISELITAVNQVQKDDTKKVRVLKLKNQVILKHKKGTQRFHVQSRKSALPFLLQ